VPGVLRIRRPIAETLRRAGFSRDVAMLTAVGVSRQKLLRARRKRAGFRGPPPYRRGGARGGANLGTGL
jgi:hypothetical protein